MNTSQCSQESEDLNLESEKHIQTGNVLGIQKLTNMQSKLMKGISQNTKTMEMQQKLIQKDYQVLICSVEDFLVNHSVSLEKGKVSKIPEAHCFLTLQEYLHAKDLHIYSLKMLKGYSVTTKGKLLPKSFKHWMNWGIVLNGWYVTARISMFHKTEKECSFLDFKEEKPQNKYYLSEKTLKGLIKRIRRGWNSSMMEIIKARESILYQELLQQFPQASQEEIIFRLFQKYIRRLTPMETERIQSFPDGWTDTVSETQRYTQCGNAVTVNVIEGIVRCLPLDDKQEGGNGIPPTIEIVGILPKRL